MATGELFSTKFYNYESSTNPAGEKLNASKGLVAVPSTDKVKNQDDFAGRNAFNYIDCNFTMNDSGDKIPVAIKGGNGFSNTGKVDVGIMTPPTYWGKEEFDGYYIIHFSDTRIRKWAVPFRLRGQMKVLDTESSQNTMPV